MNNVQELGVPSQKMIKEIEEIILFIQLGYEEEFLEKKSFYKPLTRMFHSTMVAPASLEISDLYLFLDFFSNLLLLFFL